MTLVFLNLLINATFSLVAGITIVGTALWFFRIPNGNWKAALLLIPFAKIIFDFAKGIPANSVIAAGIDPFTLPSKHQLIMVGFAPTNWGPKLSIILGTTGLDGANYASSIGDYLAIWVDRQFGHQLPVIIVSMSAAVSVILLVVRIIQGFRFEKYRSADRQKAFTLSGLHVSGRTIDIYTSEGFSGTPFTGGVLRPYICIPEDARSRLNQNEVDAVIGHEVGHIIKLDLVVTFIVQIISDFFWFVPGYRWLACRIDDLRELNADVWATEHGTDPVYLASALIKLREIPKVPDRFVLYSAFFRRKSLLKRRVEILLGDRREAPSRFGWDNKLFRCAIAVLVLTMVMLTTIGGNQTTQALDNPEWFTYILRSMGLS